MSESYQKWFKAKLEKLQAIDCYSAGVTPEGLAEQLGVDQSKIVKLNFNENLFVDRAKQTALMKQLAEEIDLRMYPEDEEAKLREKLSGYIGVPADYLAYGIRFRTAQSRPNCGLYRGLCLCRRI
jgi:histidinol-phosphate/aromatic aminotransferase/cobyric acid decarboxylase-like protein